MTPILFILEGHKVVPCNDPNEWSDFFLADVDARRRVALTHIDMDVDVSTVFLGINTNLSRIPMVFETMVFGGTYDYMQVRYPTWIDAVEGHKQWVEKAIQAKKVKINNG